jgi:hypothetical protein
VVRQLFERSEFASAFLSVPFAVHDPHWTFEQLPISAEHLQPLPSLFGVHRLTANVAPFDPVLNANG